MNKTFKNDFTMVEAMIVVVILAVLGGVAFSFCGNVNSSRGSAEDSARSWVQSMYHGETIHGLRCQEVDTDSDGYVSCTVRVGDRAPMAIDCPVWHSWNSGCRLSRGVLQQPQQ